MFISQSDCRWKTGDGPCGAIGDKDEGIALQLAAGIGEVAEEAALIAILLRMCLVIVPSRNGAMPALTKSTNALSHVKPDVRDRGAEPGAYRSALASEVI